MSLFRCWFYFLTIWMTSSCSMTCVRPTLWGLYLVLVPWRNKRQHVIFLHSFVCIKSPKSPCSELELHTITYWSITTDDNVSSKANKELKLAELNIFKSLSGPTLSLFLSCHHTHDSCSTWTLQVYVNFWRPSNIHSHLQTVSFSSSVYIVFKLFCLWILTHTRAYLNWLAKVLWIRWHCKKTDKHAQYGFNCYMLNIVSTVFHFMHVIRTTCSTLEPFLIMMGSLKSGRSKGKQRIIIRSSSIWQECIYVELWQSYRIYENSYPLFSWYKGKSGTSIPTTSPEDNPGSTSSRSWKRKTLLMNHCIYGQSKITDAKRKKTYRHLTWWQHYWVCEPGGPPPRWRFDPLYCTPVNGTNTVRVQT